MKGNDELTIIVSVISLVVLIGFYAYYFSQGGSNTDCYNCGKKLKFGEHKDYSVLDRENNRQNICSTCYRKLERKRVGKYW